MRSPPIPVEMSESSTAIFVEASEVSASLRVSDCVAMATTDKYDRQLRLWGAHGQVRCETRVLLLQLLLQRWLILCRQRSLNAARILLLNCGPTGSEALKNLVLPGCGRITVCDPHRVAARDLGNNFFVTQADIGRPRAQARRCRCCDGAASLHWHALFMH